MKLEVWKNTFLKRRLETISHQNYERVDIAISFFLALGTIGTFVTSLVLIALQKTYFYTWIPGWISFVIVWILSWLFFTQRNLKRITVLQLFATIIYGIVCLAVVADEELVNMSKTFFNSKNLQSSIDIAEKNVPIAIGIIINCLFTGLVTIQIISIIYLIFDYWWWRGFVKSRRLRNVWRNSIIHMVVVIAFSGGIIATLTLITDLINPMVIDTKIAGDSDVKEWMETLSSVVWKLLNLILFPSFAMIGRLNMDAATGDNANLKGIGFKIKIAIFFAISPQVNKIITYIQLSYIAVGALTSIISIVVYYIEVANEQHIPYMISMFYQKVESITKYELQEMSKESLKTLGLKHVKKTKFEEW